MPIRPENKHRYPKNWKVISASIRIRARDRCESCGLPNKALGGRDTHGNWLTAMPIAINARGFPLEFPMPGLQGWCSDGRAALRLKIVRIVLTIAHLNHQPEDCAPENLKCWCQQCHLRYDAKMKAAGLKSRRRARNAVGELFATKEI
jgi:hypothetical protein